MAANTAPMTAEEKKNKVVRTLVLLVCLVAAIGLAIHIVRLTDNEVTRTADLKLSIGYVLLVLIFFIGFVILIDLAGGRIDLSQLLEEKGSGGASMGRFQLLIFTFVIGLSLFYVVICKKDFPDVPNTVLALLGVSATTYGVGKGIQATKDDDTGQDGNTPAPAPPAPVVAPAAAAPAAPGPAAPAPGAAVPGGG